MLAFLEAKSRTVYCYMIIGMTVAVIASQVNTFVLIAADYDYFFTTTNLTPITEELLKALPVLFYAYAVAENCDNVISVAFATGIGFAILENLTMLFQSDSGTLLWIFSRGIGSGLMHGLCTGAIGWGITLFKKGRLIVLPGLLATVIFSMIYHGIFNTLVQSDEHQVFGILLPALSYLPLLYLFSKNRMEKKKTLA